MKLNSNSKAGTTADSSTNVDGEIRQATLEQNPLLAAGWYAVTETPPDELVKVIDKNGQKGFAYPTYYPFKVGKSNGGKVAAKYRDPATGQSWTGRGKAPKWIDGKDRAQFLIA